jgi:hypothetical protein
MLTPYTRAPRLISFQTYDLEWYPRTYQLRLIGCYDGERYTSYTRVEDFLESHVFQQPSGTSFFAHAGGSHDVQFILLDLIARNDPRFDLSAVFSGSSAIIVKVQRGDDHWIFCDSFWLLRDRLASIAVSLGEKKGGTDYSCQVCMHPPDEACIFHAPLSILRDYNEMDCGILWRAIDRLQTELLEMGGELRYTIASCAMRLFRRVYLKKSIDTCPTVNAIARQAYIASRVEVIRPRCDNPANWYDINSSFPFSMTSPQPGSFHRVKNTLDDCDELALVRATITIPQMYLPPVPYRKGGRIFFPVGTWESWFDIADIRAIENWGGSIDKIHSVFTFHPFDDLANYVHTIYEQRKASTDSFQRVVRKYLLNSLYGKLAERGEKERMIIDPKSTTCPHLDSDGNPKHVEDGISQCMRMVVPRIWLVSEIQQLSHEHVPIPAHVTALSRQLLGKYMRLSLEQGGNLYYCDTDGFPTETTLDTSDELGGLKLEKTIKNSAVFIAPKFYRVDDAVRSKGFSRLTRGEFDAIEENPKGGIEFTRMLRLREVFRSGEMVIREKKMVKRLLLDETRTKRKVEGNNSRAWTVEEINEP